jgi:hypothetical protein
MNSEQKAALIVLITFLSSTIAGAIFMILLIKATS